MLTQQPNEDGPFSSENSPLLVKKEASQIESSKNDEDNEEAIAFVQKLRGESNLKWFILFCNCVGWFSTWCVITNLSTVENSVRKQYNMSDTQFSVMFTATYATAVIASALTGKFLDMSCVKDIFYLSLYGRILLFLGQFLFFISCLWLESTPNQNLNRRSNKHILVTMFVSRIIIGISSGLDEVLVVNINSLWFGESRYFVFSFLLCLASFELGILTVRYIPLPFIHLFDLTLAYVFTVGLFFSFLAVIACICMILAKSYHNNYLREQRGVDVPKFRVESNFLMAFDGEKGLSKYTWLVLFYICCCYGTYTVYLSLMTEPLIVKYNISEWQSDLLISILDMSSVICAPIIGYVLSVVGTAKQLYFTLAGCIAVTASLCMYCFLSESISSSTPVFRWVMLLLFTLGGDFSGPPSYEFAFRICKPSQITMVSAYIAVGGYAMSGILTVLFSMLSFNNNYNYSVGLILVISVMCFILMVKFYIHQKTTHGNILYPEEEDEKASQSKEYEDIKDTKSVQA